MIINVNAKEMLKPSKGICNGCSKYCFIVNKTYNLCSSCNSERLHGKNKDKRTKMRFTRKKTGEAELFAKIWEERSHYCENCGAFLGDEARVHFFSHIKSKASHPELRLDPSNIELLCMACHHARDFQGEDAFLKRKRR